MTPSSKRRGFIRQGIAGLVGGGLLSRGLRGFVDEIPPGRESPAESIVLILLAGGLSHIDSFDPKPKASVEVRGEFGVIQTTVAGVLLSDQLPKLAASFNKLTLLRGVSHDVSVHEPGQKFALSGVKDFRAQTPSLGAVFSHQRQADGTIPTYAAVPSLGPNAGELGQSNEPFNVLGDSGRILKMGPDLHNHSDMSAFQRRLSLLERIEQDSPQESETAGLRIRREAYQQAARLLRSETMRNLSDLTSETSAARDLYGRTTDGDFLLLARRFLEAGTRFLTVTLSGWDTHYDSFPELRGLLHSFDHALAGFINDLEVRGRLSRTIVAVVTEFGRTPMLSDGGRGHFPGAGVALLAGGRFRNGIVYGQTDKAGAEVIDGRCSPQDIAFTVLSEVGIAPDRTFLPPTGRVLLPEGRFLNDIVQGHA